MEMFALIDPYWGEPRPVPSTLRETPEAAMMAALTATECSLYSGARRVVKDGQEQVAPGRWDGLERQGFRIARVRLEIVD